MNLHLAYSHKPEADHDSVQIKTEARSRLSSIASHLGSGSATGKIDMDSGLQKKRLLVTRSLGPDVMPLLMERDDLEVILWEEDSKCPRQWLLDNVKGIDGLLVMLTERVDEEVVNAAGPNLKVISTMSVGYEHVSLPSLAKRGIRLGYTPGVLTGAVADLTVMLAIMAGRNGGETMDFVKEGKWPGLSWGPFNFTGPQISLMPSPAPGIPGWSFVHKKKTAGFLGFGRIAQATLHRLIGFGITDCIYVSNPASTANQHKYQERDADILKMYPTLKSIRAVSLQELAAESDMLFILAPGGPETYHLVNEEFLKRMKKTSILVNTARGTLVDSDALAKSLKEGWIWGAGLDCVEGEPAITKDHLLLKEPRCVILPHIGSATTESRLAMATLTAQNVIAGMGLSLGGEHRAGVMLEELDLSRFA